MMKPTEEQLAELKIVETEMLRVFIDVCKKLELRYYLVEGTLLGAVRHQGFIPWDDDIDVGMPREDYEIFLKKGQDLLPEHLFIQSLHSDAEYPMCFAKLRNSMTTFVESSIAHLNINHGVYIDIFPLDYYPEEETAQKRFERRNYCYKRRISMIYKIPGKKALKTRMASLCMLLLYPSVKKVIRKRERLYRETPPSTMLASYGGAWGKKETVPVDWYGEGTLVVFEGMEVSAPVKYHNWLSQVYGDYMQLPPPEERVGHHYTDVIDLNTTYKNYTKKKK